MSNILEVKDLRLSFPAPDGGRNEVLKGIDFRLRDGEILGLIGNSGSGKSMTALTVSGLLPEGASVDGGSIIFDGKEIFDMPAKERRLLLGSEIGLIFQDPMSALDPLEKIGKNLEEILKVRKTPKEERRKIICDMLTTVDFKNAEEICERYPHQLSGGQRQRVLIAGAALLKPRLLIADEPTSALDTVTTVSILELLKSLCVKFNMTILFISHDLAAVGNFCDRVMVMQNGEIVDSDVTEDILHNPKNAFTAELLTKAKLDTTYLGIKLPTVDYSRSPIMDVRGITAGYKNTPSGFFKPATKTKTVDDVSFQVWQNEMVGLIGSSGCGKTTLAKTLCGLIKPTSGSADFRLPDKQDTSFPDQPLGVVFQDPISCLNPSHTIRWHLCEPLRTKYKRSELTPDKKRELILRALQDVGMEEKHLDRYPSQLSGGQRQRIAIAMCLILDPSVIIADEPFSSLDASSASSILQLLSKICLERKTAVILISHNLHIVRTMCKRVLVMDSGKIAEEGLTSEVLKDPQATATKKLLEAEVKLGRK